MPFRANKAASSIFSRFAKPHPATLLALAGLGLLPAGPGQAQEASPQRLSPAVRVQPLPAPGPAALEPHRIEPFLAEPLVVEESAFARAPRIVAAPEGRVLITLGDRAYVLGPAGFPLDAASGGQAGATYRVFRGGRAIRDPATGAVLGFEAQLVGRATLVRHEAVQADAASGTAVPVPAIVGIVDAREEIRAGDHLLPDAPREVRTYTPRAPEVPIEGARIAAMHGDAVGFAGQNQVVVVNKGRADGLDAGHVLAVIKRGVQVDDRSLPGPPQRIRLPDERTGLLMVFRPFDRLSYALVLESADGVKVGDRVAAP